ncbi:MAG: UPF0280 family protein [Gammaproteobacteria bacterium]
MALSSSGAQRTPIGGRRWHFHHGPIDIIIGADGDALALAAAHEESWQRFETVLVELVAELPMLRRAIAPADVAPGLSDPCPLQGRISRRMWSACRPFRAGFITPMAAVAGAVAEELVAHYQRPGIARAWINNGGDVALHLAAGKSLRVGLFADLARFDPSDDSSDLRTDASFSVDADLPVRGIATSGWRGRSFSFGIADSVTVLARTATEADAAATVIANAVDVPGDARIVRRPACELKDDTDLGSRLVTYDVLPLPAAAVHEALRAGRERALQLRASGLIWSAILVCQGWFASIEDATPQRLAACAAASSAPESTAGESRSIR